MTRLRPRESEKGFMQAVREMARVYGWRDFHCYDARRSPAGFPDLILVRWTPRQSDAGRLIAAELKTERGRLTTDQHEWLDLLSRIAGVETYIWRPSQWHEIQRILQEEPQR